MSMTGYYIPLELEHFIRHCVLMLFLVSTVLNGATFFCLLKVSDLSRSGMNKYLFYLQCTVFLHDLHLEVLFEAYPLFPLLIGYCYGILCHCGVPILVNFGIVIFNMGQMGTAIVMCLVYRHQSILLPTNPLKFKPQVILCFHVALSLVMSVPGLVMTTAPTDLIKSDELIEKNNVTWVRDRGAVMYVMFDRFWQLNFAIFWSLGLLISAAVVLLSMVYHILFVLKHELCCPFFFVIFPAATVLMALYSDKLVIFEVSLACYYALHFHGVVHSTMILALTPAYRRYAAKLLNKRRGSRVVEISSKDKYGLQRRFSNFPK